LNEVNIRTSSEESKSPSEVEQEASKESWRSKTENEELQVIQEEAQELNGSSLTDSRYSGALSQRVSQGDSRGSGRLVGCVGTARGRQTAFEVSQGEEAKEVYKDHQPKSTPSDILIKFKEDQNKNRPLK
jgi:hypothetical protein